MYDSESVVDSPNGDILAGLHHHEKLLEELNICLEALENNVNTILRPPSPEVRSDESDSPERSMLAERIGNNNDRLRQMVLRIEDLNRRIDL